MINSGTTKYNIWRNRRGVAINGFDSTWIQIRKHWQYGSVYVTGADLSLKLHRRMNDVPYATNVSTKRRNNRTWLVCQLRPSLLWDVENCSSLGYYTASSGNYFRHFCTTYRSRLLKCQESEKSWILNPWWLDRFVCPETSLGIYYYLLRNSPEECSFYLLLGCYIRGAGW